MKTVIKKWKSLFLVPAVLATLLFALPVFAAVEKLDETNEQALEESVESYLDQVLSLGEEDLEALRDYGDFYNIMVDCIEENAEELGTYEGIESASVSYTEDNILVTTKVNYSNYDAELQMYFDETAAEPLNFTIDVDYPMGIKLAQAGGNTLIGVVIVFVLLVFLALVISLFGFINPDTKKKSAKKTGEAPVTAQAKPVLQKTAAPVAEPAVSDDSEIIAVIAAAIAAAEAEGGNTGNHYVVRSIRKVGTARNWKRA